MGARAAGEVRQQPANGGFGAEFVEMCIRDRAESHATDEHLLLCANTLAATGAQAPATLRTVPAAVLHLAQRQGEGWAYIRA